MLLFFLLDVIERVARALVLEFKNAGVIQMGGMLFCGEQIGAEETVGLFLLCFA